ncbi:hypothetical protein HDU96_010064, partial [Phlyctochytrium bullatum]
MFAPPTIPASELTKNLKSGQGRAQEDENATAERSDATFTPPTIPASKMKPSSEQAPNNSSTDHSEPIFTPPTIPASKINKDRNVEPSPEQGKETVSTEHSHSEKTRAEPPRDQKGENIIPEIPYSAPPWSGVCPSRFWFEVLKGGVILEEYPISKAFLVAGRLPVCDLVLIHGSISRYHCVIQGREDDRMFAYDLGSTHQTFLNKKPLPPRKYVEIKPGDILRFGCSSRLFVLNSDRVEQPAEKPHAQQSRPSDEVTVTWGMQEDASEDSSFDTLSYEQRKDMLLNWIQENGLEMDIKFSTKREGGQLVHKASMTLETDEGKFVARGEGLRKAEAEKDCIEDACKTLYEAGRLGSSGRPRVGISMDNDLEEESDSFYDRTLKEPKKRQREVVSESFETLSAKILATQSKLKSLEARLQELSNAKDTEINEDLDELEKYMNDLEKGSQQRNKEATFKEYISVKQEQAHLSKLLKIADAEKASEFMKNLELADTGLEPTASNPPKEPHPTKRVQSSTGVEPRLSSAFPDSALNAQSDPGKVKSVEPRNSPQKSEKRIKVEKP